MTLVKAQINRIQLCVTLILLASPLSGYGDEKSKINIGFGISLPTTAGITLSAKFSDDIGAKIVWSGTDSFAVQLDFYRFGGEPVYWFLGAGRDNAASVAKTGIGYEKNIGPLLGYAEIGLSYPRFHEEGNGLAESAYIVGAGTGLLYRFK